MKLIPNPDWTEIERLIEAVMNNPTEENFDKLTAYLEYEDADN